MLRSCLSFSFALLFYLSPLHAQDKIAVFEEMQAFRGYPADRAIDSEGHANRGTWFTGRWICSVITKGKIGVPKQVPFTAPGSAAVDEKVVAIVALDSESEAKLSLRIMPEFQPGWDSEFNFCIVSKDVFCLATPAGHKTEASDEMNLLIASLERRTITTRKVTRKSSDDFFRLLTVEPSLLQQLLNGGSEIKAGLIPPDSTLIGDGWDSASQIDLSAEPETRQFVAAGSKSGNIVSVNVIGRHRFSISESDSLLQERKLWLLTEIAFESDSEGAESDVIGLAFPRVLIAPAGNFVMAVTNAEGTSSLFVITRGRLRKIWNVPADYSVFRLELSENEQHVAVQLMSDKQEPDNDMMVHIDLSTATAESESKTTENSGFLLLAGITNQGTLVLEADNGRLLIDKTGWKRPREIAQIIKDR